MNQVGVARAHRIGREAEGIALLTVEVLDEHVGHREQVGQRGPVTIRRQVEAHPPLVRVAVLVGEWRRRPPVAGLDAHHVGAEVGEDARRTSRRGDR